MSIQKYNPNRKTGSEKKRAEDLMRLVRPISDKKKNAIDIGARDGYFSVLMTEFYKNITALDLEKPSFLHKSINCVQGDITNLNFIDESFDFVFCAEVLEHISPHLLQKVCFELERISKEYLLIGVPYKQDIRVDRTKCYSCGGKNPPWGHVNSFNIKKLQSLFPHSEIIEVSFVGKTNSRTNFISAFIMDLADNPRGTYGQIEACIHCGEKLKLPPKRSFSQEICTISAYSLNYIQKLFYKAHPNWVHLLFKKIAYNPTAD